MSKIALFTDLHIGVHQNNENWYSTAIQWVKWFKTICIENKVENIIFCGDYFDTRHEINNKLHKTKKFVIRYDYVCKHKVNLSIGFCDSGALLHHHYCF